MSKRLPRTPKGRKEALKIAYDLYVDAHQSTAKTKYWQDEHPAEHVIFPMGFVVTNPDEVLEKMRPFQRELSR